MKTCNNCYWKEQCEQSEGFDNVRCVDYDPLVGGGNIAAREYEISLRERVEAYRSIVSEQQDDEEE